MAQRSRPSQIRITGAGLWFILLSLVVAVAGTNTGNNALFLVLALMLALLALSGVASRWNVLDLVVSAEPPDEVYANKPAFLEFALANRSRFLPRWCLQVAADRRERARLVAWLPARGESRGRLELLERQRGLSKVDAIEVSSPFPFGFFRKGQAYKVDLELLVYPEIFALGERPTGGSGHSGEVGGTEAGGGHDLRQLRPFRDGDDPRGIHWKQSARMGSLVFLEREKDRGRRVAIVFDNGAGRLSDEGRRRFERLVSEAATAAVDFLDHGFEVELVTRGSHLPFGTGRRQRRAVLEHLALIEPRPARREALQASDPATPEIRLAMQGGQMQAAS